MFFLFVFAVLQTFFLSLLMYLFLLIVFLVEPSLQMFPCWQITKSSHVVAPVIWSMPIRRKKTTQRQMPPQQSCQLTFYMMVQQHLEFHALDRSRRGAGVSCPAAFWEKPYWELPPAAYQCSQSPQPCVCLWKPSTVAETAELMERHHTDSQKHNQSQKQSARVCMW